MGFWDDVQSGISDAGSYLQDTFGSLLPDRQEQINQVDVDDPRFGLPGFDSLRQNVPSTNIERAQQSGFVPDQQALVRGLQADAAGQGLVQQQIQRNLQDSFGRSLANQQAAAQTSRGNPALAQLAAAQQAGNVQSGLAGQNAALGLQAQQQAQGQLGQALGSFRGQDQNLAQLRQQGQVAQGQLGLGAAQEQRALAQAQQQGQLEAQRLAAQQGNLAAQLPSGVDRLVSAGAGVLSDIAGMFGSSK